MGWYKRAEYEGREARKRGEPCESPYAGDVKHTQEHAGWLRGWNNADWLIQKTREWAKAEQRHDPELDKRLSTWDMPL